MIIIGFNIPNIIKSIQGENTGDRILIVDNENIYENQLELLQQEPQERMHQQQLLH